MNRMTKTSATLETERLLLRHWQLDDAEALYKYASNPNIGPRAGWPAHTSVEDSRKTLIDVLMVPEQYAIVLKETGEPIGSIGLKTGSNTHMIQGPNECELGYWIGEPFWGQGLVAEAGTILIKRAFEDLGMTKIWLGYYDGNAQSARVAQKLGFEYHHATEGMQVLGEIRTGHALMLSRQRWN